jgi:beta-glucosidase
MLDAVLGQMPLRAIVASSGGKVGFGTLDALLRVLNASALGRRSRA